MLLLKLCIYASGSAMAGNISWMSLSECYSDASSWCQCRRISFLLLPFQVWESARSHTEPCQGSRVVAELQEWHDLLKKPEPSELCARVHCRDAEPTCKMPISLASCDKRQVSGAAELQHINVHSLFDLRRLFIVNNPFHVKNNQHDFQFGAHLTRFLRPWRLWRLPLRRLTFVSGSYP
jgi:hypothetical protein